MTAWLLVRTVIQAGELAKVNARYSAYALYFGALQRLVVVAVGLGIGLALLRLRPLPMLITFGVAQLAYAIAAGRANLRS